MRTTARDRLVGRGGAPGQSRLVRESCRRGELRSARMGKRIIILRDTGNVDSLTLTRKALAFLLGGDCAGERAPVTGSDPYWNQVLPQLTHSDGTRLRREKIQRQRLSRDGWRFCVATGGLNDGCGDGSRRQTAH